MTIRRHIFLLLGLLGLSLVVQAVVISRAVVPGIDAVRFVQIAQSTETEGFASALRSTGEQPLFPTWLWLVHEGLGMLSGNSPASWAISAQWAAALPLIFTVVPVYGLSIRLLGPAAGLVGALLFCVLPEAARLGAEGISDSTHLLFCSLALWGMIVWFGREEEKASYQSHALLFLVGLATGLAVLTRAEAWILPLTLVISLVISKAWPRLYHWLFGIQRENDTANAQTSMSKESTKYWLWLTSSQWRPACGYVFGLALVLIPYLAMVGATTPRAASARLLGRYHPPEPEPFHHVLLESPVGEEGFSLVFPAKEKSLRRRGLQAALVQFGEEFADGLNYWGIGVLAWGLWRLRGRPLRPEDRLVRVFFLIFSAGVLWFAAGEGYLSARHLMPLVVVALPTVGWGLLGFRHHGVLFKVGMAATVIVCLAQLAQPLHASRRGHRQAGAWLSKPNRARGAVLDTRGWTALYSGRKTYPYSTAEIALADPALAYIIARKEETEQETLRGRSLRHVLRRGARPVAMFTPGTPEQIVAIYRWDPARWRSWQVSQNKNALRR